MKAGTQERQRRLPAFLPSLFKLAVVALVALTAHPLPAAETNAALTTALRELTTPSKKLPFKDIIQATTGHRLIPFDTNNPAHAALRVKILQAAVRASERVRAAGLDAARANEAGNQLEPFVRAAMRDSGLDAHVPKTSAGRTQAVGYPDLEIDGAVPAYVELKTYNATTRDTTQRSFYYSPSATPKVTRDALHLLLAFELEKQERDGKTVFVPNHWKLLTLEDLDVDLKFEFNQSNRGLYGPARATLDEAPVK